MISFITGMKLNWREITEFKVEINWKFAVKCKLEKQKHNINQWELKFVKFKLENLINSILVSPL